MSKMYAWKLNDTTFYYTITPYPEVNDKMKINSRTWVNIYDVASDYSYIQRDFGSAYAYRYPDGDIFTTKNVILQYGIFQVSDSNRITYPIAYTSGRSYGIGFSLGIASSNNLNTQRMPRNLSATGFDYTYKSSYSTGDGRWITIGY